MITPTLTLIVAFVAPILIVAVSKIIDSTRGRNLGGDVDKIFEEEKMAFAGVVEEKLAQVRDNTIDLDIAVKKANALSKVLESNITKLSPKIESYKDYEAAISRYQNQVEALEEAHLEILNRLDTVLKERHTIDKAYKRISDVKGKMLDLESNINTVQKRLIDSYKSKFDEFEVELNERFEILTQNIKSRDAQYDVYADKERERISGIVEDFENSVSTKEALFTKHLTDLASRAAKDNIVQLSDLFDRGREEFLSKYNAFASEISSKANDIETKFNTLSLSKGKLEEDLDTLHFTIRDRLDKIAKESTQEFTENIEKTMFMFTSSLKEEILKLNEEKEAMFDSISEKADLLENSINEKTGIMEEILVDFEDSINSRTMGIEENLNKKISDIDIDIQDRINNLKEDVESKKASIELALNAKSETIDSKLSEIDNYSKNIYDEYKKNVSKVDEEFDKLRIDVQERLSKQLSTFSNHIKDALENDNNGAITLYEGKRKELEDLFSKVDTMSKEALVHVSKRLDEIKSEAVAMKDSVLDDISKEFMNSIGILKNDIELKIEMLGNKISQVSSIADDVISTFESRREYITNSISDKIDDKTTQCVSKLKNEFDSMRATVEEDINVYIDKLSKDILHSEDMMKDVVDRFNEMKDSMDDFDTDVKIRIIDKISDIENILSKLEDDVLSSKSLLEEKISDVENAISSAKSDVESFGENYIDSLKIEVRDIFENETRERLDILNSEINTVLSKVDENNIAQKEAKDSIEEGLKYFREQLDLNLKENEDITTSTRNNVLNLFNAEIKKATEDIAGVIDIRRLEMNELKSELDDILHRIEEGKDVIEKNIEKVYDRIGEKEEELFEKVSSQYEKMDDGVNKIYDRIKEKEEAIISDVKDRCIELQSNMNIILESIETKRLDAINHLEDKQKEIESFTDDMLDKTNDIMDITDKKYADFEVKISDILENFKNREEELVSNVASEYSSIENSFKSSLEEKKENLNELDSKLNDILSRLQGFEKESSEIKGRIDTTIGDVENYKLTIDEKKASIDEKFDVVSKDIDEKVDYYNTLLENKLKELDDKASDIFTNIEDSTFSKLDELRSLIDGAVLRYKDEIAEIEDIRDSKKNIVLNEIEDVVNKMKIDYDNYSKLLESGYETEKENIKTYAKNAIRDIEKNMELSDLKVKEFSKKELSEYLDKYADDINSKLDERLKVLEESRNLIGEGLEKSFLSLENKINSKLDEIVEGNKADNKRAINKFIERSEELMAGYDREFNERIEHSLSSIKAGDDDRIETIENEIKNILDKMNSIDEPSTYSDDLYKRVDGLESLFEKYSKETTDKNEEFSNRVSENKNVFLESLTLLRGVVQNIKNEFDSRLETLATIDDLEKVKSAIVKDIEELKDEVYTKFNSITDSVDNISTGVMNEKDVSALSNSEKSLIEFQLEGLKEDIENMKIDITDILSNHTSTDNISNDSVDKEIENYKEDIISKFEDFKNIIFSRIDENSDSISSIENIIASEKLNILKDIDDIKVDIKMLKDINTDSDLVTRDELAEVKEGLKNISDDLRRYTYLEDEVENMRASIDNNTSGLSDLRDMVSSINLSSLEIEIADIRNRLDNEIVGENVENSLVSKEDLTYIEGELSSIRELIENNKDYIETIRDTTPTNEELKYLSDEIANIKAIADNSVDTINALRDGDISSIEDKLNSVMKALDNNKKLIENVEAKEDSISDNEIKYLENEINSLKKIFDDNREYIESIKDKASYEHVSYIEDTLNIIRTTIDENKDSIDGIKSRVDSIDLSSLEGDINSIKELSNNNKSAIDNIENRLDENREDIENVKSKILDIDLSDVKEDISSIKELTNNNKSAIDNIENKFFDDIKYLEKELSEIKDKFDLSQIDIDTIKNSHSNVDITTIENSINSIKQIIDENVAEIDSIKNKLSSDSKSNIENDISYIKDVLDTNSKEIEAIKTKASKADMKLLEDEISNIREVIENNANLLSDIKSKVDDNSFATTKDLEDIRASIFERISSLDDIGKKISDGINAYIERFKKLLTDTYGFSKEHVDNLFDNENLNFENSLSKLKDSIDERFKSIEVDTLSNLIRENDNFKGLMENRISHFEDIYASPDRIKEVYREAVNDELDKLKNNADEIFNSINLKIVEIENDYDGKIGRLDDNLLAASEKINSFETHRLDNLNLEIQKTKFDIDNYISSIQDKIKSQDDRLSTIDNLYKTFEESVDKLKEEKNRVVGMLEDKEGMIEDRIRSLSDSIIDASDRMEDIVYQKESMLLERLKETEDKLKSIDDSIKNEIDTRRDSVSEMLNSFEETITQEKNSIKENVRGFVAEEILKVDTFEDTKKSILDLENTLKEKIENTFSKVEDDIETNILKLENMLTSHKADVLDEFKKYIDSESDIIREEALKTNSYYLKELDISFENAKTLYNEKQEEKVYEMREFLNSLRDEYTQKLEDINSGFDILKSSVLNASNEIKDLVNQKKEMEEYLKDSSDIIDNIDTKIKMLDNEFNPALERLETMVNEKSSVLQERINNSYQEIENTEEAFKNKVVAISDKFNQIFGERIEKIDNIVEKAEYKYTEVLDMFDKKMISLISEKESQFDAIKAHYEGMSNSLYALRDNISEQINDKIKEGNSIIDDNLTNIEESVEERYEKYIARLSASLESKVADLMSEAKGHIEKVHSDIKVVYDSKLDNMSSIISSLENDILETVNDAQAKIEDLDSKFDTKSEILLSDIDTKTKLLISEITKNIMDIENSSSDKYKTIDEKYNAFDTKLNTLSEELKKYLDDIAILENAKTTTESIQGEINNLNQLLDSINLSKKDIEETTSEMKNVKAMHDEIVSYMENISNERNAIADTEEKVKTLLELSGDMQERFANLAENNVLIEHAEDNIRMVVDLASDVERKLDSLRSKEGFIKEAMESVESISIQNDNILEKIKDIKVAMIDAEDTRNSIKAKLEELEKDTAKFNKNDKKIRSVIEKFDQFDILIDELGNQRDNLLKIKSTYDAQGEKIENHLVKAESAIKTLDNLLKTANSILFEDGIPTVKLSTKKDIYKGIDSSVDAKKEKLVVDLYKEGWKIEQIVRHTDYSTEDVEHIINKWKDGQ